MLTKYQLYYSSDKHCFFSKAMEVYSTTHLGKKTVAIKCKYDNRKSKNYMEAEKMWQEKMRGLKYIILQMSVKYAKEMSTC